MHKLAFVSIAFVAAGALTLQLAAQKKNAKSPESASAAIDPEKIRAHVKFLAGDLLEGRGTGERGGDIAAEYIATQFALDGLRPAGDKDSYFQDVPMVGVKTLPETSFKLVPNSGEPLPLKNLDDFVTSNESQTQTADIDAPIVFVGYGITAPEYQWDDYKGYDLRGKVALLFVNEPLSDDPKFFKGKALTYYGRWTYKFEEAARRGAVAALIIHRTDLASYGWQVVRNSWGVGKSYLRREPGVPKLQAASWVQLDVAKKLVGMAGLDLDKLFQQSQSRDFQPIELPVRLQAHVVSELRSFVSRNVLAKLPGNTGKFSDEAVLYTAHYDHLGINPGMPGHNIYNGAVDNGTGCGILLELARVWSLSNPAPPRSILLAAVTGEEQGLLGSEYLGKHSPVPPAKITLDLNYDALQPIGEPEEVEVTGAERTTFYPVVEATAREFGLAIRPDSRPEAGHYYRSDHFSLARVGVPAFSISEGLKYAGHDAAWGDAQAKDYTDHRYHQPADQYQQYMDFSGLGTMARFGYALGHKAASQPNVAGWQRGDEFEEARKKSQATTPLGSSLFDGLPQLRVAHYEPIVYPPLARQTRFGGTVKLHVVVDKTGAVFAATTNEAPDASSVQKMLVEAAKKNIAKWKFQPLNAEKVEFDMTYEFAVGDTNEDYIEFFPQRIQIVAAGVRIETDRANAMAAR